MYVCPLVGAYIDTCLSRMRIICVVWERSVSSYVMCGVGEVSVIIRHMWCGRGQCHHTSCVVWERSVSSHIICGVGEVSVIICHVWCGRGQCHNTSCVAQLLISGQLPGYI